MTFLYYLLSILIFTHLFTQTKTEYSITKNSENIGKIYSAIFKDNDVNGEINLIIKDSIEIKKQLHENYTNFFSVVDSSFIIMHKFLYIQLYYNIEKSVNYSFIAVEHGITYDTLEYSLTDENFIYKTKNLTLSNNFKYHIRSKKNNTKIALVVNKNFGIINLEFQSPYKKEQFDFKLIKVFSL